MADRHARPAPTLQDILARYDELDTLLSKARHELLHGDTAEGQRLAAGVVQKTHTLDRMIVTLLPEARDAYTMRAVERHVPPSEEETSQ